MGGKLLYDDWLREEIAATEPMCHEFELVFFTKLSEKYNL